MAVHGLGRIKDPPDLRDHPIARYLAIEPAEVLPAESSTPPRIRAYDQKQTPMCVGFSGALGREITEIADLGRKIRFDGADLYNLAKQVDGYAGDGTYIRAAADQLVNVGALVTRGSTKIGVHKGDRMKIDHYARMRGHLEIKNALIADAPGFVWIGSTWYDSWFHPYPGGLLPRPTTEAGGHAFSILQYDDAFSVTGSLAAPGAYLCQNSWGSWGDHGRFWLPYDYVDFNDVDVWRTFDILDRPA